MKNKPAGFALILVFAGLWVGADLFHRLSNGPADPEQAVLARVGDRTISVADFNRYFYSIPGYSQQVFAKHRRALLFYMIMPKMLPLLAQKLGYDREPSVIAELNHPAPGDRTFRWDQILTRVLTNRLYAGELAITDSALRRYYDYHKGWYENAMVVDALRIYITTEQRADMARARLIKGERFDAVAKALSQDPFSAALGGRIEPILVNQKPSRLQKILLFMPDNQVSAVLPEGGGFVIYKKIGARAASFESLKTTIESRLRREKMNSWIQGHWKDIDIEIDDKLLWALDLRPSI